MGTSIWYEENLLAERLGVSRFALEQFRKESLKKNRDWKLEHKEIHWSPLAAEKLLASLGVSPAVLNGAPEKKEPELVQLTIAQIYPNPRLLLATRLDNGDFVRVTVPNNRNFRPKMTIQAHPPAPAPAPQLYRLEGRCPRFPGKW